MGIFSRLFRPNVASLFALKDANGLVAALKHKNLRTRWEALLALNDGTIRPMAWSEIAVFLLKDPASIPVLQALLAVPYGYCGSFAVLSLLWSTAEKYPEEVKPSLAKLTVNICALLNNKNSVVREFAAHLLGFGGDPQAVEPLSKALGDPHHAVCSAAAEALGKVGGAPAVEALIETFQQKFKDHKTNSSDTSYESAAKGLGYTKDRKAAEVLAAAMATSADDFEIQHIAKALTSIGEPAFDSALNLLKSGSVRAKCAAVGVLGKIKDPRAVEPLVEALRNEEHYMSFGQFATRVSDCACSALVEMGPPAKGALTTAAESGASNVKKSARKALQSIEALERARANS